MTPMPRITVHGWNDDGPAYTIHRSLAGFRNRHKRRRGESADEVVGDIEYVDPWGDPHASLIFAVGDDEQWAFAAPHVYEVQVLVDGDAHALLIDAREGHAQHHFTDGLELIEWRAVEGNEELEAVLQDGPQQPTNVSDGAESQEPAATHHPDNGDLLNMGSVALTEPKVTTLTGAQTEPAEGDLPTTDEVELTEPPAGTPVSEEDAANAAEPRDPDAGNPESTDEDDVEEPSAGDDDFDGTILDFVELIGALTDVELAHYGAVDSRKGIREAAELERAARADGSSPGDDEDAVGGDGVPGSGGEE